MTLRDDIANEVKHIFAATWSQRDGQIVPEPANVKLDNEAVHFERATVLYADLDGSTAMVDTKNWMFAAEVYRSYLFAAGKLIREEGGKITAYDGDRAMAVFIGEAQTTPAVRCALKLNYAVAKIINPALKAQYPTVNFVVKQVIGIDTSSIRAARVGVRGGNDLVWVGRAANYAAKLANLGGQESIWLTESAYERTAHTLGTANKEAMFKKYTWTQMGGQAIRGSSWTWSF